MKTKKPANWPTASKPFAGRSMVFLTIIPIIALASCTTEIPVCVSPDGSVSISVIRMDPQGSFGYRVDLNGTAVSTPTKLGIALSQDGWDFTGKLHLTRTDTAGFRERYRLTSGKQVEVDESGNELICTFANKAENEMLIRFRAFNDGIAFRFETNNPAPDTLLSEESGFAIDPASRAWMMKFRWDYEDYYSLRNLDTLKEPVYMLPALFKTTDTTWLLACESGVYTQYPAAQIRTFAPGIFSFHLPDQKVPSGEPRKDTWEECIAKETSTVVVPANLKTPWRILLVSDNLGSIVESNLVEALSEPNALADTSWCQAGVSTFPWWGDSEANDKPEVMREYVDFAAEMGWKYIEFDIGLLGNKGGYAANYWRDIDYIPEIIAYATTKGIGVVGWDERRYLDNPEKRDDIFSKYRSWGVKGIKVDFINSDKQEAMAFRDTILRHAARYELMVSFHGDMSPRGLRRTYPNLMTQEGVKGAEYYKFDEKYGRADPVHNATLPFTRNIVGPMDYTPVSFSSVVRTTSVAHELALAFIYESGWVNVADRPDVIRQSPGYDLLKQLSASWDETRFVAGYPGEYCSLARRSGNRWFLSTINGPGQRNIQVTFDFLEEGSYPARLYRDTNSQPNSLEIIDMKIRSGDTRLFETLPNGGWVLSIGERLQ